MYEKREQKPFSMIKTNTIFLNFEHFMGLYYVKGFHFSVSFFIFMINTYCF